MGMMHTMNIWWYSVLTIMQGVSVMQFLGDGSCQATFRLPFSFWPSWPLFYSLIPFFFSFSLFSTLGLLSLLSSFLSIISFGVLHVSRFVCLISILWNASPLLSHDISTISKPALKCRLRHYISTDTHYLVLFSLLE
jgi:hypothetical protein